MNEMNNGNKSCDPYKLTERSVTKHASDSVCENDSEESKSEKEGEDTAPVGWNEMPAMPREPKAALLMLYERMYQKAWYMKVDKSNYISWSSGEGHDIWWTSVFMCPINGCMFPSIQCGNEWKRGDHDLIWQKKKKLSENGAAARAWYCHTTKVTPPLELPIFVLPFEVQVQINKLRHDSLRLCCAFHRDS